MPADSTVFDGFSAVPESPMSHRLVAAPGVVFTTLGCDTVNGAWRCRIASQNLTPGLAPDPTGARSEMWAHDILRPLWSASAATCRPGGRSHPTTWGPIFCTYYPEPLLPGYQPAPGELIALSVRTGDTRRQNAPVVAAWRTNVVLVPVAVGKYAL